MTAQETTVRPEWPTEEPDAATLIRFYVGEGQFFLGLMNTYVKGVITPEGAADSLLTARYIAAVGRMQHAYDVVVTLNALIRLDTAEADAVALLLWCAADAGDWYGEMFWEWATQEGFDPDAIHAAGVEAAEAQS